MVNNIMDEIIIVGEANLTTVVDVDPSTPTNVLQTGDNSSQSSFFPNLQGEGL